MREQEFPIAIVGAGFAGLAMAVELKSHGIESFTIYEKASELGGTWRDNTYPGCACDVPSHLYSFSFDPNPEWSRAFSPQPEILDYMKKCARDRDLLRHIEFDTEIQSAAFDADSGVWTLETATGENVRARAIVLGIGAIARPFIPEFEGLESFRGETWHSAEWNHDYDLREKRVGAIGTGASAIQYVPAIAPTVGELTVFQRSPPWIVPKPDREYADWQKFLFRNVPGVHRLFRTTKYWLMEALATGLIVDTRFMKPFEWYARRHLERSVDDPDLRRSLTPDYTMGCKRVLFSDEYYPALTRENVDLVTSGIERFTPDGIVTADGRHHPFDAVVFGTGFHVSNFLSHMDITGLDGRELNQAWRGGAEAYYGVAASGFPNLFMLVGPNTELGHSSIIFMIEAQAHLIRQAIQRVIGEEATYIDVRPATNRGFNDSLQKRLKDTVWQSGCHNWYLDETGRNSTLWPGYTCEYWLRTRRLDPDAFRLSWK